MRKPAKEYALDLWTKFWPKTANDNSCKLCVSQCIDEVVYFLTWTDQKESSETYQYLMDVKAEIELL